MAREAALEWLAVADIDLKAARNCLHGPEPTPQAAAYHCQQAAEKLIKAALVAEGVHPPRSHDIGGLAELLPSGHPLRPTFTRLERLTVYAIAYRYPAADILANTKPHCSQPVMPAPVAGIHVLKDTQYQRCGWPGLRPAMTK